MGEKLSYLSTGLSSGSSRFPAGGLSGELLLLWGSSQNSVRARVQHHGRQKIRTMRGNEASSSRAMGGTIDKHFQRSEGLLWRVAEQLSGGGGVWR